MKRNRGYNELRRTQATLFPFNPIYAGSIEFVPFEHAGKEDCAALKEVASSGLCLDVVRDFGEERVRTYSELGARALVHRCQRIAKLPDMEAYIVRVCLDTSVRKAMGVASISVANPKLRDGQPEQVDHLERLLLDENGEPIPACVGTFWFGLLGEDPNTDESMHVRDVYSRAIASPLVARMCAIGNGDRLVPVTFEAPVGETSVSGGMRDAMTPSGIVGLWEGTVANSGHPYELLTAKQ